MEGGERERGRERGERERERERGWEGRGGFNANMIISNT